MRAMRPMRRNGLRGFRTSLRSVAALAIACALGPAGAALAQDADLDDAPDGADTCRDVANRDQNDTNNDGIGNLCDADYNNDGVVGIPDFARFRDAFGKKVGDAGFDQDVDADGDGRIGLADFNVLRRYFGKAPGPGAERSCKGRPDGAGCTDFDPSTSQDRCQEGICVGGGLAAGARTALAERDEIQQPFDEAPLKEIGLVPTDVPAFDGDRLVLRARDPQGVPGTPDAVLRALGAALDVQPDLGMVDVVVDDRSKVDRFANAVAALADGKPLDEEALRAFSLLFPGEKPPDPPTPDDVKRIETLANRYLGIGLPEIRRYASRGRRVLAYQQSLEGFPVETSQVLVITVPAVPDGLLVLGAKARLFREASIQNKLLLALGDALARGGEQLEREASVKVMGIDDRLPKPAVVLLPIRRGLRHAWRLHLATSFGPFAVWVDAEDGALLQFAGDRREATVTGFQDRAPRALGPGTDTFNGLISDSVPVDPPSGGLYRLRFAGETTNVVDSVGPEVTSSDDNFNNECRDGDTNGSNSECTIAAGFNDDLDECTAYQIVRELRERFDLFGADPVEPLELRVNVGETSAWANVGVLSFGRANANRADCPNFSGTDDWLLSKSLDPTAMAHEFGHRVHANQVPAGSDVAWSLGEGLGDYWGVAYGSGFQPAAGYTFDANDRLIEARFEWYVCRKRYWLDGEDPLQTGSVCRAGDPTDQFEDRMAGSNECHRDGHVIHWALASARDEMRRKMPSFPLLGLMFELSVIDALQSYGITVSTPCSDTDLKVHDSFHEVLDELLSVMVADTGLDDHINQVKAGFARANLFENPADAVVNATDDFLLENGPAAKFEVWSGRPYSFAGGNLTTATPPFNTQYRLQVANDSLFTSNAVDTGWLDMDGSDTVRDTPCPDQTDGNCVVYTLATADWNVLDNASRIYYKVRTRRADGTNVVDSTSLDGSSIPVPWANVTADGNDCTCGIGSELVFLIPPALWLRGRRRARRITATPTDPEDPRRALASR